MSEDNRVVVLVSAYIQEPKILITSSSHEYIFRKFLESSQTRCVSATSVTSPSCWCSAKASPVLARDWS